MADRFPNLTIVTGHWGEVVLFYLDRADMLSGAAKLPRTISEYFRQHVYVTLSGLFSHRYLNWALEVLGAEHILFARDLADMVTKGALMRSGERRHARYALSIHLRSVSPVTINEEGDILQ